jgi:hypothetical protein
VPLLFCCFRSVKGKAVLLTSHEGPWGCERSMLLHLLDNRLTDGGEVVNLTRPPPLYCPGRFLVLISVRGWVDPRPIVPLGLGKLKKSSDLIGIRTRDLQACSTVPQPTTLQCEYIDEVAQGRWEVRVIIYNLIGDYCAILQSVREHVALSLT